MTFWLFSGWDQKSGAEICSSSLASLSFCAWRVKDSSARRQPVGGAEVFAFQFFESHSKISVARAAPFCEETRGTQTSRMAGSPLK